MFIVILVIVLVIIVLGQLMKINDYSQKLRNKDEANLTEGETKFNAVLAGLFYIALMISSTYLFIVYGGKPGLGESASIQGEQIDTLFAANWALLLFVFYITQTLLFVFAIKYRYNKDRKATFFSHSNRLELIWTIVPTVALAGIIIWGLTVWNRVTAPTENATVIEIYAKQFDWTVRYSGEDNKLGNSDFKMITSKNPLGVVTTNLIDNKQVVWENEILKLEESIENSSLIPDVTVSEMKSKVARLKRQIRRLAPLKAIQTAENDKTAEDDVIVKELYLVKGKTYEFKFRARESIHSAYFPHFRAQMNCVPGMITRTSFTPSITTADKRKEPLIAENFKKINKDRAEKGLEEEEFNYILLCNKICGASHYKMKMIVTVVTQPEFDVWYKKQKSTKNFSKLVGLETKVEKEENPSSIVVDTNQVIVEKIVATAAH